MEMLRAKSLITDPQPLRPHISKGELGGANKAITWVAGLMDSRPRYQSSQMTYGPDSQHDASLWT